jgi:tripartite-type tricarboxylate transporter receptor subunit TctC
MTNAPLRGRRRLSPARAAPTVAALALAMAVLGAAQVAQAQAWPARPVKVLVGFPPGTATDVITRLVTTRLAEANGWTMVVENRAGQGGSLAAEVTAKSPPDGYTLLMTATAPLATNPNLYSRIGYDSTKDFAPITLVANLPYILVVNTATPAKSVAELVALARAKPKELNYGTLGNGTTAHLIAAMFSKQTGIEMTHVPYKGSVESITGLLGDQTQLTFDTVVATLPHIRAGKLRALAVSTAQRATQLPDVPTLAESGLAGFDAGAWLGLVAPAGTPRDVVQRINAETHKLLATADVREKLAGMGAVILVNTPEQFQQHINTELVKWGRAVKDSGARVE